MNEMNMQMDYYKSKETDRILLRQDLEIAKEIYGDMADMDIFEKIDPPSVIDCITHARNFVAVYRYREMNGCSLPQAKDAIRKMKYDMRKANRKKQ